MAYQLSTNSDFSELKKYLRCNHKNPTNLRVLSALSHVERGTTEGSVFTDDWPNVQTVLVALKFGSIQNLIVGGEQHEKALEMITSSEIVDWNFDVLIAGADPTAAKEILKKSTLCPPPVHLNQKLPTNFDVHVLYGELLDTGRSIPNEISLKPLDPSDIPLVASKWKYLTPSKARIVFAKCVEVGESVGAYMKTENGEQQLVSWAMQYQRGSLAHLYTLEEHRKRGLALAVVHELCRRLKAKGQTPVVEVEEGNRTANRLFQKLGFTLNQQSITFLRNFE